MGKNNKYQKKNRSRLFGRFVAFCLGGATIGTGIAGLASENARIFISDTATKIGDKNTYIQAFEDVVGWGQSVVEVLRNKGYSANYNSEKNKIEIEGKIDEQKDFGFSTENNSPSLDGNVSESKISGDTAQQGRTAGNKVDEVARDFAESATDNSQKLGETDLTNKTIDELKSEIYNRVKSLLKENENLSRFGSQFETDDQIIAILEKTIAEKNKQTIESEAPSLYDFINFSDTVAKDEEFNKSIQRAISNYSLLQGATEKAEKDAQGDATPTEEISKDIEEKTPEKNPSVQAYDTQRSQVKLGLAGALAGVGIASFAVFEYLKRRIAKGSTARKSETRFYMGQNNVSSARKLSKVEHEIDKRNKKIRSLTEKKVRKGDSKSKLLDLGINRQLKKIAKLEKKEEKLEAKCYRATKYSADKNKETDFKQLKRFSRRALNLELNSFVNRTRGKKRKNFFSDEDKFGIETYANIMKSANYYAKYRTSNRSTHLKKLIKHLNGLSQQQRKLIFDPHVYFAESVDMTGFQQKQEYGKLIIKELDPKHRGKNSTDITAVPRLPLSMDRYFKTPTSLPDKEYYLFRDMFNKLHKQYPNVEKGTVYTTVSYQYKDYNGNIQSEAYHFAFNNKKAAKTFKGMIVSKVGTLANLTHVEVSETTVTPYTIKENTKIFAAENKNKSGPNIGGTINDFKYEYAYNKTKKLLEELKAMNNVFSKVDKADNLVARRLSGTDELVNGKNKYELLREKKIGFFRRKILEHKARKQIEKEYKNPKISDEETFEEISDERDPRLVQIIENREIDLGLRKRTKKGKLESVAKEAKKAKKKAEKAKKKAEKTKKPEANVTAKQKPVQVSVTQPTEEKPKQPVSKPETMAPKTVARPEQTVATPAPQNKVVERKAEEQETPKQPVPAEHKVANKKVFSNTETTEDNFNFPPYNPPPTGECKIRDPYNEAFVEGEVVNAEDGTPVDLSARAVNNFETTYVDAEVVDEEKEKLEYEREQLKNIKEKLELGKEVEDLKKQIRKLQKSADAQESKSPEKKATTKKALTQEKVKTTISSSAVQTETQTQKKVAPQKKVTKTTSKIETSKQPKDNDELGD
ncbi:MAG: hypothetical protein SO085_02550 [Eubacteriales bacterium]|nr:hypothetical protein [Eubacteriales bacterium]